jgi:hypothetical protein
LRAGLLSDPEVIGRLNEKFVCTTVVIDDVRKRAEAGDEFAKQLKGHWTYPLEMIFLRPDGGLMSKLNSFKDFPGVHPDVAAPPGKNRVEVASDRAHVDAFLKHLEGQSAQSKGEPRP